MLQQTQVQTVVPYYLKFLKLFPDLRTLAGARPEELLRAWAGLGYYSRVRALQLTAQKILRDHVGRFPEDYQTLLSLPGIGRYTASAILSIAFNQQYPVVDGNVTRVLCRMFKLTGDPKGTQVQKRLWDLAASLLTLESPGSFNQAIMELGATVCLPRSPHCLLCPWQDVCLARRAGIQEDLPRKSRSLSPRKSLRAVAIIQHRGRLLIVRREDERVLQGFWEFPGVESLTKRALKSTLVSQMDRRYGLKISLNGLFLKLSHSITRNRITLYVYLTNLASKQRASKTGRDARWIRLSEAGRYPFSSVPMRIVKALNESKLKDERKRGLGQHG